MNALALPHEEVRSGWLAPFGAAVLLALLVLLMLALANHQPDRVREVAHPGAVTFDTVQVPEPSAPADGAASTADLSTLLPATAPAELAQLEVQPQPVELRVDLSQMVQKRYSYRDLGKISGHHGGFGLSNLSDVDEPVQSVFIPPNVFPDSLFAAGIREGRVTVVIVVDEQGRASVKRVLGSTHPNLVNPVVESINKALYTAPTRHGKPTKVVVTRVVTFAARPERALMRDGPDPSAPLP